MVTNSRFGVSSSPGYNLDTPGRRSTWDKTYIGIVKNSSDSQYMGRLLVWIAELCGPENDPNTWIVVDYASPFGGATSITGGSNQSSYGMWFVPPDEGNQVVCLFVNGDPNRGLWLACLYQVGRHRMVPAYPGNSATQREPSALVRSTGGLTLSSGDLAGLGITASSESQAASTSTPPPELPRAVGNTTPAPAAPGGGPVPDVSASQTSARTANIPVIGPSSYSSHNSYSVNGIATPGGNRLVMSDQLTDTQIRIQTRNNMQLLLHNDRDIAVLMTGDGRSRIELNGNGDIDIFGEGKISFAAEGDLNLHSNSGDVNINAGGQLNLRSAGDTKITSVGRMHLYSKGNLMQTSEGDTHRSSNGHMYDTSVQKIHRQSNFGIYDSVNGGDINQFARGNIFQRATEEINTLSSLATRIRSESSSVNIKSGSNLNLQSGDSINLLSTQDFNIDAGQQGNIRAQGSSLNLQSQNSDINLSGGPRVVIGPVTEINAGSVPSAQGADASENAIEGVESLSATAASQVTVVQHIVTYTGNRLGGGATFRMVSSVSSRVPSAEPAPNRFVACPGYSGTNTVERSETIGATFRVGQIEDNQSVPLQAMGFIGKGATITVGSANLNNFAAPITPGGGERRNGILMGIPPEGRGLLDAIAVPESGGKYNVLYGGVSFNDYRDHPRYAVPIRSGPNAGNTSSAAGRYQFLGSTWDSISGKYGLRDFGPENQDRAAWYLAQENYRSRTGGDLYTDLQAGRLQQVSQALSPTWTSLSGGIEAQKAGTGSSFASNYARGVAAANAGVTANNAPASPEKQEDNPVTDELPQRYIGVGYTRDALAPIYVKDPVPNWIFKQVGEFELSETGLTDIKNFETSKGPKPSDEPGKMFRNVCDSVNMIGYGHVLGDNDKSVTINGTVINIENGITDEQALDLLKQDLKPIESAVKSAITNVVTQEHYDALVDFAWNIGVDKFKNSDVVKFINNKEYDRVPTEMIRWVEACKFVREELVSRRRANALRFAGIMRAETPAVISGGSEPGGQTFDPQQYPWLRFTTGAQGVVNNPNNPDALTKTNPRILELANRMGEILQTPLLVNSAYRSESYNASIGGTPSRPGQPKTGHMAGLGLDISNRNIPGSSPVEKNNILVRTAQNLGAKTFDNYPTHIHIQLDSGGGQQR